MTKQKFSPAIEAFLVELAKSPREWRINQGREIRNGPDPLDCECPLVEECRRRIGREFTNSLFQDAGELIGVPRHQSPLVAAAADGDCEDTECCALRARILEACGLKEEA